MKTSLFTTLLLVMLTASLYGQSGSINNTLGTGGSFSIKDGSTTFLSLSQSNGYLSLNRSLTLPVTTSSTLGVIFKGADRFIHDYQASGTDGFNTFVGVNSGNFTMSGVNNYDASYNTSVGHSSLTSLTTGYINSAFGYGSLYSNTSGFHNSAFGYYSLYANTTGIENSAFGGASLYANTTGGGNSAFGFTSLYSNTSGFHNSAFGYFSLYANTTGNENSAFGASSLQANTTGNQNSAFGYYSLYANTSGFHNSAFGFTSLYSNITGTENTALGYQSLYSNTTNSGNTAVGWKSLFANTGFQNTAVGHHSLNANTTGNYNTALGYNAGSTITTGYNLTCIGIDAAPLSPTAIDQVTLGNAFVSSLRCNVQSISSLSDARDKKNIKDLPLGLDFLMSVKPRLFNWDRREWYEDGKADGSKMRENPTAGFIAQELDEAQVSADADWLNLVLKSNPERLEATPGSLLPIMVKAIQELKKSGDRKDEHIAELTEKLGRFEHIQQSLVSEIERIRSEDGKTLGQLRHGN